MCALRILKTKRIRGGGAGGGKLDIPVPPKREPFRKPMDGASLETLVDQLVATIFTEPVVMQIHDVMAVILSRPLADVEIARQFTSRPIRWLATESMLLYLRQQRIVQFEDFGGRLNHEQVVLNQILESGQNGFVVKHRDGSGVMIAGGVKGGSHAS